jgi:hypothetical protein
MITTATFPAWVTERRAYYDRAPTKAEREVTRFQVRKMAQRCGAECPEWARKQTSLVIQRVPSPATTQQEKPERERRQDHAAPPSAPAPKLTERQAKRENGRKVAARQRRSAPEPMGPAVEPCTPVSLDPRLNAWRERYPGAVVQVGQTGVRVHLIGETRSFPDVSAALAALEGS